MPTKKKPQKKAPRIAEKRLPVPGIYATLPLNYKSIVSEQGLALLFREGIDSDEIESTLSKHVFTNVEWVLLRSMATLNVQSRDLLCQLLIEAREQTALLKEILEEARK